MRWLTLPTVIMILLAFVPISAAAQTPVATPVILHPSCEELPEYVDEVIGGTLRSLPDDSQKVIRPFIESNQDLTMMRPSELRQLSEAFDRWAGELEDVDPDDVPHVAREYHETLIEHISLVSAVSNSVATSGVFALFAYADAGEKLEQSWDEIRMTGRSMCGNAWEVLDDDFNVSDD